MVRFSRVWRTLLRMGHPQVRWLVWLMTQDGLMPSQFQGDEGGAGALPRNRVECAKKGAECECIFNAGLIPNIPENPCNRKHPKRGRKRLFNAAKYLSKTNLIF